MSAIKKSQKSNIDFSANPEDIASFALSLDDPDDATSSSNTNNPKSTKDEKPNLRLPRLPYKITAPPEGLAVVEYSIQPTKIVCFSGDKHFLSSFYRSRFEMSGITYLSVEHYYQATKLYSLCGYQTAAKLQYINAPFKAKQVAKQLINQYRINKNQIEAWKRTDGLVTLIYAVALKFIQNPDLRQKLLNTRDSLLVQTHPGDNFYAAGMDKDEFEKWAADHAGQTLKLPYSINEYTLKHFPLIGKGQNILGVICMKVRSELTNVSQDLLYSKDFINRLLLKLIS